MLRKEIAKKEKGKKHTRARVSTKITFLASFGASCCEEKHLVNANCLEEEAMEDDEGHRDLIGRNLGSCCTAAARKEK